MGALSSWNQIRDDLANQGSRLQSHCPLGVSITDYPYRASLLFALAYVRQAPPSLELELIQTHMKQKPILRVEMGALGARQVQNAKGGLGRRSTVRRLGGCVRMS